MVLLSLFVGLVVAFTALVLKHRWTLSTRRPAPIVYEELKASSAPDESSSAVSKRILVIGGQGFVGKYLVARLVESHPDYHVTIMDMTLPSSKSLPSIETAPLPFLSPACYLNHPRVAFIRGDITNPDHLDRACRNKHLVYHMASLLPGIGISRETFWKVNVTGTQNVIDACKRNNVPALLYTSSATVVIRKNDYCLENIAEDYPLPPSHESLDLYTASKGAAEKLILDANSPTLATAVLRPSAVFGIGDKMVADVYLTRESNFYLGDGKALVDFVHVDSVAQGHEKAGEHLKIGSKLAGQIYHLATGSGIEYRRFRGVDSDIFWGNPEKPTSLPYALIGFLASMNEILFHLVGWAPLGIAVSITSISYTQRTYWFNIDKAKRDFGYAPINVADGVAQCYKDYVAGQKKLKSA